MLLWYFWIYSFLGYLLEKMFAKESGARLQGRKCFLFLPLCPVYGLGMLAVLALPETLTRGVIGLIVCGGAATVVEYAVHWAYDAFLGVRFWDYSGVFGNLRGRICLLFSLIWGGLTVAAVRWIHPRVEHLAERTVPEVTYLCLMVFALDAFCSLRLLKATGDPERLRADRG